MKEIFVEGHRGFCAEYPENTLLSYRKAIELGVDGFEFDIWLTKDKIPVLIHDGGCLRTCGVNRHVRDMTYAEVRELDACFESKFGDKFKGQGVGIPTLRELCELVKELRPDMALGVEIKEYTEETVDISVAILKEYGFFDRAWFYAFDAKTIKYLKTAYGARTMGYPDFQMRNFESDSYSYYDEIGIAMNIARSEVFPIFAAKGMKMHLFCADTEEDVRFCIEKGASLITANDPGPLLKVLGR